MSKHPAKRAAQLRNLKPPKPPERGNRRAVRHGGEAEPTALALSAKEQEIALVIAEAAPIRERGALPVADGPMVGLLAKAIIRLESVSTWLDTHGAIDRRGRVRAAVHVEARLRGEVRSYLVEMAMSPKARAAIGADLVRARDLAQEMSDADTIEGTATDD